MEICDNIMDKYLHEDERIIWSGKPDTKTIYDKNDKYYIPFSLLWVGVAIQKIYVGYDLLLLLLIGLYLLIGRFIYKNYKKKATCYIVTNQRVVIIKKLQWNEIDFTEISIKSITHIEKEIRPNGIGNIRFGHTPWVYLSNENTGLKFLVGPSKIYGTPAPTFFDIEDADMVYQIVMGQKRAGKN